jgi:rod shape-determining protein MreD
MPGQATMSFVFRAIVALTPVLLGIFALIIVNLPLSLTGGLIPAPLLALAPVYFWSLVRPDLMPPVAALGLGLLEDLLSGGAPGVWGGGFLAAYFFAERQRDQLAGLSGSGAILGFAAAMFVAAGVAYILAALAYWQTPPVGPLLLQSAVTVAFYPLVAVLMNRIHRSFIGSRRDD